MSDNDKSGPTSETTSFGFHDVPVGERQGLVNQVFAAVAGRYDLMNDLMSGGIHRLWKSELIHLLNPPRSERRFHFIDVAGGTGDVALRALAKGGPGCRVTVADISAEMLDVGRRRLEKAGLLSQVEIKETNAEALSFPDKTFDAYTIAFGIRNVTHIDQALAEAYRVLKPGCRFLCLEFSACQVPLLDQLYDLHSFRVIPELGRLTTGDAGPYQYLVESIRKFPDQDRFADMIRAGGFANVGYRNLSGGIAAIHWGWRI